MYNKQCHGDNKVGRIRDIEIDKSESRTNWLQRPLTQKQLEYAAADTYHLLPCFELIIDSIKAADLFDIVINESELVANKRAFQTPDELLYKEIKNAWQLKPHELAVLKELAVWRRNKAIRKTSWLESKIRFSKNEIGSSISCSGTCLTLEKHKGNVSKFYISKETLNRTNFKSSNKGDLINLEKSLKYGDRISGHFVQGHVDTTSIIKRIDIIGKSWFINFKLLKKYNKYLVQKGSITINGVSLTISKILKDGFQIVIIPQTLKLTNLIYLKEKYVVNVEFDVLGKYIKKFLKWLKKNFQKLVTFWKMLNVAKCSSW